MRPLLLLAASLFPLASRHALGLLDVYREPLPYSSKDILRDSFKSKQFQTNPPKLGYDPFNSESSRWQYCSLSVALFPGD